MSARLKGAATTSKATATTIATAMIVILMRRNHSGKVPVSGGANKTGRPRIPEGVKCKILIVFGLGAARDEEHITD